MSKAFTTDSDDDDTSLDAPTLPPGTRNYMTYLGAERLRAEIENLNHERKMLSTGMEGKTRGQTIDRRLRYLLPRLEALEVIDPLTQAKDRILFGATVEITDNGNPATWRIVGLDEVDLDQGWISWMSPLASALLEKKVGDVVTFMGRRLTILDIAYQK